MKGRVQQLLLQLLLLSYLYSVVQCFVNSPKIVSKDGNLIFESGANRNISFRLSGTSRLIINEEYDVLDLLMPMSERKKRPGGSSKDEWTSDEIVDLRDLSDQLNEFKAQSLGSNGLNTMLGVQLNRTQASRLLLRRLQVRLRIVENKAQRLKTRLDQDSCKSNPCENGGTCYDTLDGFRCQCRAAFEGQKCERDVNECALFEGTDLGCQNGGQCVNQFGTFSCLCPPGWHGIHCTQRKGDCSSSSAWELCGHGSCVPSSDAVGYRCICEPGWKSNALSPSCSEDVDECSASAHTPCSTKCINLVGSFTCAPCAPGLTGNGVSCRDIDECETNNGGCSLSPRVECINTYGSSHCANCPIGWTGDGRNCVRSNSQSINGDASGQPPNAFGLTSCTQRASLCHPAAICSEISNTIVCSCPQGMVGSGYGENGCVRGTNNNCNDLPCLNGGVCLDRGPNNYTCLCPRGYRAPRCEPLPNPCTSNPCQNNGRCSQTPAGDGFVCQCQPGYRGRLCDQRFSSCNGMLVGQTGRLRYPPSGSSYQHNAQCAWVIRTNETLVLNVTFNSFNLEDSAECRFDWLQINDGRSAAAQIIGRYCGNHIPHGGNIISSSHQLYLWFRSDNSTAHEGFDLSWESITPQCGGRIDIETHGTLASPGSPGQYPKNRDCQWHLVAPRAKRIKLTFFSLQLEQHATCDFDYVQISDALTDVELFKYCSSQQPAPLTLPTHEAFIRFHSDETGSDLGFQLHYSLEDQLPGCGGIYTSARGTIKAPNIEVGSGGITCDYEIRSAAGESIAVDFEQFSLADDSCMEFYELPETNNSGGNTDGWLSVKHCGSPLQMPPSFNSMYSRLRIKYIAVRADDQFQIDYRMQCSRTFDAPNGTISSPGYPNGTRKAHSCTFRIVTAPNTIIRLQRLNFETDTSDSSEEEYGEIQTVEPRGCADGDALTFNDGLNKGIHGPYCRFVPAPLLFVSRTNMLIIHSEVTAYGNGAHFYKFKYHTMPISSYQCGGVHTKESDHIRSPTDSAGHYRNDLRCEWIIMAPPGKAILLHWHSFNLEDGDCSFDYVSIYDGLIAGQPDAERSQLLRVCGNQLPEDIVSHSRSLTVTMHTDFSDTGDGFELSYRFVDRSDCGGRIHSAEGMLTSPLYPLNYSSGLDCVWQVVTGAGRQMELQLDLFELENSTNCHADWLEVRNGMNNQSALIGRFCGTNMPRRIPSFSNQIYLHFHTNDVNQARGFRLSWRTVASGCGGRLQSDTGVITSPNYPGQYPHELHCEWQLRAHLGSQLTITLDDMELEELNSCAYDYLSIEAIDANIVPRNPIMQTLCTLPPEGNRDFQLDSNQANVIFHSDSSNSDRGFRLTYAVNCVVELDTHQSVIESLNYGVSYMAAPIDCRWTIRAPRGNRILVEFSHFDVRHEGQPNDEDGGVYLVDGQTNVTTSITTIGTHNVSSQLLSIVHNTSRINFRLEYRIDGCLYELRAMNGSFKSLNYPKMYPNDMECYWLIHAPLGQVIELTVLYMDIEESVNCTKDSLVISNSFRTYFRSERHCGRNDKLIITSAGHKLHVSFNSDGSTNGRGFEATYRIFPSKCGGRLTSKTGVISSPGYPRPYPRNSNCEWTLEVTPHHRISFTIEAMDLESGMNCNWDKLSAFDLLASDTYSMGDSDLDDTEGAEIFSLCTGKYLQREESATNRALLRFVTDDTVQHNGFRLHYRESCGQSLLIDETSYELLTISHQVARNETCVWVLRTNDPSKRIIFTPQHVQLHTDASATYATESDCMPHGIQIYEGDTTRGTARQRFCRSHPPALVSHGNALTISVPLLLVAEFEANYMTMDTMCGSEYSGLSGAFTTPYYPSSYPVNIECYWLISASSGNSLSLSIESFDLELSDGCNNDYLEIREEGLRGPLIGVYCGTQLPASIKSKGAIWMKFKSNDDVVGEGFMAKYNYDHHNELNGTAGIIESPHYPSRLDTTDKYSWRITVDSEYVIVMAVEHLRDVDLQHLHFYDGYTDIGAELQVEASRPMISHTNVMYITATHGPFRLDWQRLSKEAVASNRSAEQQTHLCGHQLVHVDSMLTFNSPGYPHGYATNLHCAWDLVPSDTATHAAVQVTTVDLEVFSDECFTDYLTVSSSNDLETWSELSKLCRPLNASGLWFHGKPYLRLEFVTDASVNKTGFATQVRSACGTELTARQGVLNVTQMLRSRTMFSEECIWTIRARQGKRLRITFLESQLRSSTMDSCLNFFVLRNGAEEDSPFLGRGKYCENNITDVLETTSNRAHIKFHKGRFMGLKAAIRYEELGHACSGQIVLEEGAGKFRSHVITSPNYPNLPNPYSECVWQIQAPPQHRISLEFEAFDLTPSSSPKNDSGTVETDNVDEGCDQEFVQLNDGATELMPQLGRYCGNRKPNVVYSSGSVLRVKFYTSILEPRTGFKATVKLADCGGSYYTPNGVISSPNLKQFPLQLQTQVARECVYTIEMEKGSTIELNFGAMQLPGDPQNCTGRTHLLLEEIEPFGDNYQEERISDRLTVCGTQSRRFLVETNKVVMHLIVPNGQLGVQESFQLRYAAVGTRCGETIEASMGVLQTPNYPLGVRVPTHCLWRIQVPKYRRVRVEILDFDIGSTQSSYRGRLVFAQDLNMQAIISRYTRDPPAEVISMDNTMSIDAFLLPFDTHRGFKLRFTAYGMSRCIKNVNEDRLVRFSNFNDSIYCSTQLTPPPNNTIRLRVMDYNTTSVMMQNRHVCNMLSPLKMLLTDSAKPLLPTFLCSGAAAINQSVLLPFPVEVIVNGNRRNELRSLALDYSIENCGGVWPLEPGDNMTITQPAADKTHCAWAVGPNANAEDPLFPEDVQLEVSVSANLTGACDVHYLLVYNGPDQNSPLMGRYCQEVTEVNKVVERGLFVEYHAPVDTAVSSNSTPSSTFNVSVKYGSGCGGRLSYPYRQIEFNEQYKNNVECIWEIEAGSGFHVGLTFISRFYIENSNGCTKDYLRVQQLRSNSTMGDTAEWEDLQTICGRDPPLYINSTTSAMRLIFRSDGDTTADGFIARFERNCGGILYADDAPRVLNSPGYPVGYLTNLHCNYTFLKRDPYAAGLIINFVKFDLERSPVNMCMFDNVTITTIDDNDVKNTAVLCGVKQRHVYRAQESINLIMASDSSFSGQGFQLQYGTRMCGGIVNSTQVVESPRQHQDDRMPHNSDCYWNLTAPAGSKFAIKLEQLDMEAGTRQCSFDGVEIFASPVPDEKQRLARYCGRMMSGEMPTLHINTNRALIHSYSDQSESSNGFKFVVRVMPNCDEHIMLGEQNASYTFNKYVGEYANNLDCSFVFKAPLGYYLSAEFRSFHVEATNNCAADYLVIRDGAGPFAEDLGKFCGQDLPPKLTTSQHTLFMNFVTDGGVTDTGFEFVVTAKPLTCGSQLIKFDGKQPLELRSPVNEQGNYDNNVYCLWKIESEVMLHLRFLSLDLEGPDANGSCAFDYLKIYDSENAVQLEQGYGSHMIYNGKKSRGEYFDYASEHVYCGTGIPDDFYPHTKNIYVKFHSNGANSRPGFRLQLMANAGCSHNYGGLQGRIVFADTADCDVFITAPAGYVLSLYYAEITLGTTDCSQESLEVFDKATNRSLQQQCTYVQTGSGLFTQTNDLRLHFKTGSYYSNIDLTYIANKVELGPGCGGDIYNTAGVFSNAFYPQSVRNNSNCRWNLRVPSNNRVMLHFEFIQLGSRSTCNTDYLQILEDTGRPDQQLQEMARYCGDDKPKVYKSKRSQLSVQFHKSVNNNGLGWVIRFTGVFDDYQIPQYLLE
ncbi:cubilin homolog [Drosophila sulfurigaster albostrigata]|uniref:cubilin homolog n=1 Tax=Drosophila sulfurigaster albostrigata TaxID=89887 RepID=UPI002D21C9EE|nr:cubilin homolog [Drosophila sulfurigaster albostrigata]